MVSAVDREPYLRGFVALLAADGLLGDPTWRAAVEVVPRDVFVPTFYRRDTGDVDWSPVTAADPGWLAGVYANTALVTALGVACRV